MKQCIIIIFLFYGAYCDIRDRCISKMYLVLFGMTSLVFILNELKEKGIAIETFSKLLYAILPGIIMLAISKITQEQIGYGDGLLMMILGLYLGWKDLIVVFSISLIIIMAASVMIYIFRSKLKYKGIPFIPFLFISYLLVFI